MKHKSFVLIAGILVLALAGCGGGGASATGSGAESAAEEPEMPVAAKKTGEDPFSVEVTEDPFIECNSMEEAQKFAGFEMSLPEMMTGFDTEVYRVIPKSMIEVIWKKGSDQQIRLRKAAGDEDISGDYNKYESEEDVSVDSYTVTEKKNSDGIHTAIWNSGDYSYAILSDTPLTADEVSGLVSKMSE